MTTTPVAQTVWLYMHHPDTATQDFAIEVDQADCAADDLFEDNDFLLGSQSVPELTEGTWTDLVVCPDDGADWYRVLVPAGVQAVLTVTYDPVQGNVYLYADSQDDAVSWPSNSFMDECSTTGSGAEVLRLLVRTSSRAWYVGVERHWLTTTGTGDIPYTLDIDFQ